MTRKKHEVPHPAAEMLRAAIKQRVSYLGRSHWALMEEAGLSRNAVRYIYEGKDVQWTNVANVLTALGLELYAGPYRDLESTLLLPETLRAAAHFERIARGELPEDDALVELLKVHLKLLRMARKERLKIRTLRAKES